MSSFELRIPDQIAVWERVMDIPAYRREEPEPQLTLLVQPTAQGLRKALDIGCGWGRHLIWLAEQGWRVTGLDWAQAAVRHSREALEKQRLEGTVIKGDYRRIPFRDGEFQLIVATDVLHHGRLADFRRALAEVKRVLRLGGQAFVSLPSVRNMPRLLAGSWVEDGTVVLDEGPEAGLPHHFFTEEEVRRCAIAFHDVTVEAVVEPLPPGTRPLHDAHVNEWLWVGLTG
jgi:2-polyprenyl-3-methyl-5-hydroxy-6-metoxy-1,4-benzoquinol methylase